LPLHGFAFSDNSAAPEWWYIAVLLGSIAFGIAALTAYPTATSPGAIFFGIALCASFVVPVGLVEAVTGIAVGMNGLAEFVGGAWSGGNAIASKRPALPLGLQIMLKIVPLVQ
jgi:hypothetical protein